MIHQDDRTVFLPLGGCGEIGMNLNLFSHRDRWLMVDCGVTFDDQRLDQRGRPSVVTPDPSFVLDHLNSLEALIVTHAHEDHFGAIPYSGLNYSVRFTRHLLQHRYCERSRHGVVR